VYYDPMISKLVAHGQNRDEAIAKMKRALREYEILGVKVNIPFNLFVLNHPKFVEGDFDTHFVQHYFKPELLEHCDERDERAAAIACAVLKQGTISNASQKTNGQTNGPITTASSKWKNHRIENMR